MVLSGAGVVADGVNPSFFGEGISVLLIGFPINKGLVGDIDGAFFTTLTCGARSLEDVASETRGRPIEVRLVGLTIGMREPSMLGEFSMNAKTMSC